MMLMSALVAELERENIQVSRPSFDVELADVEVTGIEHDSRSVVPGSLFACLRGASSDGHDHAASTAI